MTIASRGLALLVGVPLALGALGIPTDAVDINVPLMAEKLRASHKVAAKAPVDSSFALVTPRIREEFLLPQQPPRQLTLEVVKEQFFSTHVPYGRIIYREAKKNRLPPELVAAMISTESDFRPRLVSGKEAHGLMQIRPSTGRLLGVTNLFDPAENIAAGTKYFRYLLDHYDNERMALAAYNAGMGNVAKWGGVPPFDETQNYLRKVSTRANLYRKRIHSAYLASTRVQNAVRIQ